MRARTGSMWRDRAGRLYARVTWADAQGKTCDIKQKAMDETHALSLCKEMLKTLSKRVQPNRAGKYKRDNILIYCIQIQDGHTNPIKIGTSATYRCV